MKCKYIPESAGWQAPTITGDLDVSGGTIAGWTINASSMTIANPPSTIYITTETGEQLDVLQEITNIKCELVELKKKETLWQKLKRFLTT